VGFTNLICRTPEMNVTAKFAFLGFEDKLTSFGVLCLLGEE
jgi:hypothetical protein